VTEESIVTMPQALKVLIAEDNPADAELLVRQLRRAGFAPEWERVDDESAYLAALDRGPDLVLSDYEMPQFGGLRAIELLRGRGLDIPLIIVSGAIGEDTAVEAMKLGAADFLLKDRLARLGPSITHALQQARLRGERKRAEQVLVVANERYRALAARLETIREQERTAIAREIHDVLAQELTRLKLDLVWLSKHLGRPWDETLHTALVARTTDAIAQTDVAITTVQRIATELRPVILDSLGLPAAVEWLADDFARRTGIACEVTVPQAAFPLDRERATALFRIAQESFTNVIRHSGATAVSVSLVLDAVSVTLTVRDNGCGITTAAATDPLSIGLSGMRERAEAFSGTMEIAGAPGPGTTVAVRLPLPAA